MNLFVGVLIGALITLVLIGRPIKIEILQKTEQHDMLNVPEMNEVLKKTDAAEDQTYAEMGEALSAINEIMTGGGSRGKE